jgi:hypothetical protein
MELTEHRINTIRIAEISGDTLVIRNAADGLELLGNLYYRGFDAILLSESQLTPAFFELKNGMAGEILQKFSNYRMRLAIVGDFSKYTGRSLNDFIRESNRSGQVYFVDSVSQALTALSGIKG